jgi:hypothetical protein
MGKDKLVTQGFLILALAFFMCQTGTAPVVPAPASDAGATDPVVPAPASDAGATDPVVPAPVSDAGATDLIQLRDFEMGDLSGFYWSGSNGPEVVTFPHPVRAGNYSMRSYLHRYESQYSYRTEVHVGSDGSNPPNTGEVFRFNIGEEYWIGLSIYIPGDFVIDTSWDVLFQIQATPDPGEDYRSPVFVIETLADDWRIFSRWDSRQNSGSGNQFEGVEIIYEGALGSDIGKWTDWVIHVKWSYQDDGLLEVWRDGTRIVNREGPNCCNDEGGPFTQMGVYKSLWRDPSSPSNTDWRLFYHDELRIAGADATYEDVAPPPDGNGTPTPTPELPTPTPEPPTPPPPLLPRVTDGLQVLYTFEEGGGTRVLDVSDVSTPLDLTIENGSATSWLSGALSINSPTLVASADAATKVIDTSRTTNEITVEAWVKPADTTQDGPARIVALSEDPYNRNFTLGQGLWGELPSALYNFRLRTTATSSNGIPSLSTLAGSLTTDLSHVVYTHDASGVAKIYVNGVERASGAVGGDLSNWNEGYRLALANELTEDRPWLGEFHLVAIFNRALSQDEVIQNFRAGPPLPPRIWLPLVLKHYIDPPGISVDGPCEGLANHWLSQVCSFFVSRCRD